MFFKLRSTDRNSEARTGILTTGRGKIQTPVFMPVGTAGSVKGVSRYELEHRIKAEIILANTYHLYLRPGLETIGSAGGIHRFTGWEKPMLTDSGGYQVFSLADNRRLSKEGAVFRSHIDGSEHTFTPENVVDIQRTIGADIIMAFDECTPWPCDYDYAARSAELTHSWLDRGWKRFAGTSALYGCEQYFFPIVQGSVYSDLRKESAEYISSMNAAGNAIGGLSVGEPADVMYEMVEEVNRVLPRDKPRYLMGVGTPANILECVALGIDMFDCVMPTRNGRNGTIFTSEGIINIKNRKWKDDFRPIDAGGTSETGTQYSRAYLRHLIVSGEMLGPVIASIHNLEFYMWLMRRARAEIEAGTYRDWKNSVIPVLSGKL
ncbi:MAG: tRNA guanosine(34) transglycosylase Tgt [Marinilabiliales bacterium]|nr:MAG: tRNA guanosine(34) transglycosylase Tgt [Marinilabiliales bacterium]